MRFINNLNIDFIGKRYLYFSVSSAMLLASIAVLVLKGPTLSIEFTGGTVYQMGFKTLPPIEDVRAALTNGGLDGFNLQTQPASQSVVIKVKRGGKSQDDISSELTTLLKTAFPENVNENPDRVEFIGAVVGKSIVLNTIWALLGSFIAIVIYVAFRFKNWIWGVAGVLALTHDVFITYGLLTFLGAELSLVMVAALLTLAGYSINDTIVIFDRVRENIRTSRKETILELYNRSLNETLTRSINTSVTVFLAALALLFFGGVVIRDFSIAFSFGVLVGSYSTVGVALSMVYQMELWRKKHSAS